MFTSNTTTTTNIMTTIAHEHEHHAHEHHDHDHGHSHSHDTLTHTTHSPRRHGRNFAEIKKLIADSTLSAWVKEKSVAVFQRIAVAEGKIHGVPPEQVHFHEVGAVDSIVDIVGGCIALEMLGKPRVLAGPVVEGTGWIDCAHGRFPIPAPATLAILAARGIAVTQCDEPHELVTPTGAALLAEFAESFGPMQNLVAEKIGFGLGTRDNRTRPERPARRPRRDPQPSSQSTLNRISIGKRTPSPCSKPTWMTSTPKSSGILWKGAGGGRAGCFPHAHPDEEEPARRVAHRAVRRRGCGQVHRNDPARDQRVRRAPHLAERRKLRRELTTVKTPFGEVTVKMGKLNGKIVQAAPEFESCKKLAEKAGVPLKEVYEAAVRASNMN